MFIFTGQRAASKEARPHLRETAGIKDGAAGGGVSAEGRGPTVRQRNVDVHLTSVQTLHVQQPQRKTETFNV